MAFMAAMLKKHVKQRKLHHYVRLRRCYHAIALPSPINNLIAHNPPSNPSPPYVLPEDDRSFDNGGFGFRFPSFFSFGGSMELMAVPKRKTSPHKRGIRNGPKALKPTPVIIRCRACGRVKLPHFYCCSGKRDNEENQHHETGGQCRLLRSHSQCEKSSQEAALSESEEMHSDQNEAPVVRAEKSANEEALNELEEKMRSDQNKVKQSTG